MKAAVPARRAENLLTVFDAMPEGVLLSGIEAALCVLSTRFGAEVPRCEGFFAANRALREIGQIRELRSSGGRRL